MNILSVKYKLRWIFEFFDLWKSFGLEIMETDNGGLIPTFFCKKYFAADK